MTEKVLENDEIDLVELIKVLWNKRLWIILFSLFFTTIAGIYVFTAKEQWTSKAEIIAPRITELGDYFLVKKEYARILGSEFDASMTANNLFGQFNLLSESLDERKKFFEKSDFYKKESEGKSEREKLQILFDLMTKNIAIKKPDTKKYPDLIGNQISFYAETPIEAQNVLSKFISTVNISAYQIELDKFLTDFNEIIADLNYEKIKFERDLRIHKSVQLKNLESALNIAKEAGIKEYSKSFSIADPQLVLQAIAVSEAKVPLSDSKLSDSTYLFMLGETYLKAQIDVLKNNNIIYPPRYYQVSSQLSELEPLLIKAKQVKANAFSYQASPDYPVVRDKPKKLLILSIGFILGLILGSIYILFRKLVSNK
uniref:Wzz homolog n=1 Tax=Aggregatibacter actinomycetemcomitans TaxID=714 RepID=Q9JRS3_AGGAC|nr:Wzz homolog [Aggregatibacter actinomycetemcomitans]